MSRLYLTFALLTLAVAARAQTDTLRTIELANVIIAENRLQVPFSESARSIHIVTREDIDRSPARSVNELLTYVAGVDVRQRGPSGVQADVSVRGGTFEQTLVLINGVKVSDPQTGHHQMNLPVTLDAIERIEVLKGPAGSGLRAECLCRSHQHRYPRARRAGRIGRSLRRRLPNLRWQCGTGIARTTIPAAPLIVARPLRRVSP